MRHRNQSCEKGHGGRARLELLAALMLAGLAAAGCSSTRGAKSTYSDAAVDLSLVQTVAVMPFTNLTSEEKAGERVRDVFSTMMQATGAVTVLPQGEVARAIVKSRPVKADEPSVEEIVALGKALKVDAVILGVLREYGQVRSGNSSANTIALAIKLYETESGKLLWSGSSTAGGITASDRLFGGGGEPMQLVTEDAVRDVLNRMFGR